MQIMQSSTFGAGDGEAGWRAGWKAGRRVAGLAEGGRAGKKPSTKTRFNAPNNPQLILLLLLPMHPPDRPQECEFAPGSGSS